MLAKRRDIKRLRGLFTTVIGSVYTSIKTQPKGMLFEEVLLLICFVFLLHTIL